MAVVIGGGGKLAARIAANPQFLLFFFLLTLEVFIAVLNLLAWRAAGAEAHKASEVELYRVVAGSLNDELAVLVALALVLAGLGFDVLTAVAVRVAAFSCKKRKKGGSENVTVTRHQVKRHATAQLRHSTHQASRHTCRE